MTPAALRAAGQAEGLSWLGTPYHPCADVRGVGVDCLMLLVRVFAAIGCIPADVDPRPYPPQWHLHRSEERYLHGLEQWLHLIGEGADGCDAAALKACSADACDVVAWRFGRTYSHAGLLVRTPAGELEVVHALIDAREVTQQCVDSVPLQGRAWRAYSLFPRISTMERA